MASACDTCSEIIAAPLEEVRRDDGVPWHSDKSHRYWLVTAEKPAATYGHVSPSVTAEQIMTYHLQQDLVPDDIESDDPTVNRPAPCSLPCSPLRLFYFRNGNGWDPSTGCNLCGKIMSQIRLDNHDHLNALIDGTSPDCEAHLVCIIDIHSSIQNADVRKIALHKEYMFVRAFFNLVQGDPARIVAECTVVLHFLGQSDLCSPTEQARGEKLARALPRIQNWLKTCSENHDNCEKPPGRETQAEAGLYPARLLQINEHGGRTSLRLVDSLQILSEEPYMEYATLSHRWGERKSFSKLILANLSDFVVDIPLSEELGLSKTFAQAVSVASALGIRYLWIDALCIVQDSQEDWLREAPRMASIYSRALLNIAATAALDNSYGLFLQKGKLMHGVIHAEWASELLPKGLWWPSGVSSFWQATFNEFVGSAAINKRGWVYQERLLAPRTIHFAMDRLWWHCRQQLWNSDAESAILDVSRRNWQVHESLTEGDWGELVRDYSKTSLTVPSDKLLAFSGVAETYGKRQGFHAKDYLAGLWRHQLPEHLLWYVRSYYDPYESKHVYIAPSWSWASANGWILFVWTHLAEAYVRQPDFQVLNCHVSLLSKSCYGQVKGAAMEIEGVVSPITYSKDPIDSTLIAIIAGASYRARGDPFTRYAFDNGKESYDTLLIHLDKEDELLEPGKISMYFVPILRRTVPANAYGDESFCTDVSGLLLSPTDGQALIFKRIGLVTFKSSREIYDMPQWWTKSQISDPEVPSSGRLSSIKLV